MKKLNNRGFMLVETLIVSTMIISILIYLFIQFQNIVRGYNRSFKHNTVDALYGTANVRNFILSDGYEKLITFYNGDINNNYYIDISNCPTEYFEEVEYCSMLLEQLNIKTILFTKADISDLKDSDLSFSENMKEYIKYIKYIDNDPSYRLIVEYNDDTYGSLKMDK
ncbi:MAG: hypothetical protein PHD10_02385 [Bacilli bacterium]|nr:hypothetical protein [Bacilli bacterium]